MFLDEVELEVRSGKGGDGMVHFHREKFVPRGGPDGGDGGRGGDVILEVDEHLNTLWHFRHKKRFVAEDGQPGGSNNKSGRNGEPLVLRVPPGTMVYDAESGLLLGDLTQPGQRLVVCRGGRGGRGNARFATPTHQAPRVAEKGEPGEEKRLRLELKLLADIGIIGVPNAGKSTLLAALTNARPKIAPYPFTTLEPNLGVAALDEYATVVLADIPGLIEGAHLGIGLGNEFLRHIQRTRVLIHLLDGLSADPLADFSQINSEMAYFDPRLAQKPQVVALNKMDQPQVQERYPELREQFARKGIELHAISALTRQGTRPLLLQAVRLLQELPAEEMPAEVPVYRPKAAAREFTVTRLGPGEWRVSGEAIERAAAMTYWEHDGSVRRFQKLMEHLGVDEALRQAGIQEGDTVYIGDFELEWAE
jgi:GTP-binding protein